MSRLPPLNALRTFEAAARHGSFTLAAAELCVTPGAVSRQVRALEDHLGQALFARANRKVILTEAGQRYFTLISGPFAELARAGDALRREAGADRVRLDCVPTLAMHWLLQRLPGFRAAHPGLDVDMRTATGPVDLAQEFDFAIRRDPAHFAGLMAVPLMTEWSLPVCSPAFQARHALRTPEDMRRVPGVSIRAREDLWPSWCRAHGISSTRLAEAQTVDHTFVAMQAAEDGLGVAVVPLLFAHRLLEAGRLACPLPGNEAATGSYSLLRRPGKPRPLAETFAAWLMDECARPTTPPDGAACRGW
jgi:LysR family glycine cleavage system transcriptional activator